ncbi:MAG: hypothetical protein H6909_01545 [Rickettsiaceae bacterium]|nr:hypothetical protein [Rickettsiaceae bacterium]
MSNSDQSLMKLREDVRSSNPSLWTTQDIDQIPTAPIVIAIPEEGRVLPSLIESTISVANQITYEELVANISHLMRIGAIPADSFMNQNPSDIASIIIASIIIAQSSNNNLNNAELPANFDIFTNIKSFFVGIIGQCYEFIHAMESILFNNICDIWSYFSISENINPNNIQQDNEDTLLTGAEANNLDSSL